MSKKTQLTLMYFNIRGRGEIIRLLLHAAAVKFVDDRVEFSDWPQMRESAPNGALPFIQYQGNQYGEVMPVVRFLARKYKMIGKTELEQLDVDILLNRVDQFRTAGARLKTDSILNDAQKKDLRQKFTEETLPQFLQKMNERLEFSQKGFLVGLTITVADIALFDALDSLEQEFPGIIEQHPFLKYHYERVSGLPKISAYLETRPRTKM